MTGIRASGTYPERADSQGAGRVRLGAARRRGARLLCRAAAATDCGRRASDRAGGRKGARAGEVVGGGRVASGQRVSVAFRRGREESANEWFDFDI